MTLSCPPIWLRFVVMVRNFSLIICLVMLSIWQPLTAWSASTTEARALLEQGKDADAVKMLNNLLAENPGNYQGWFMLGVAEAHQKHFQAAIRHFRKVIELRPTLAEPHNNLAVIYNELGDLRAAVRELEASLELNPDYSTAHENIGDLYVKLALEAYQKALIDEDSPELKLRYQRLLHLRDARLGGSAVNAPDGKAPQVLPLLTAATRAEILAAVERWRAAWSARNVDTYFAAYSKDFKPAGRFATQAEWQRYKRRIIRKQSFIEVRLDAIQLSPVSGDRVRVDFMQYFKSDNYNSKDHKQLLLEKSQDGWKVVNESVI